MYEEIEIAVDESFYEGYVKIAVDFDIVQADRSVGIMGDFIEINNVYVISVDEESEPELLEKIEEHINNNLDNYKHEIIETLGGLLCE
jgi:hypothetical protein